MEILYIYNSVFSDVWFDSLEWFLMKYINRSLCFIVNIINFFFVPCTLISLL